MSLEMSSITDPSLRAPLKVRSPGPSVKRKIHLRLLLVIQSLCLRSNLDPGEISVNDLLVLDPLQRIRFPNRLQVLHGVTAQIAVEVFPDAQQEEGNNRGSDPEFGLPRGFGLGFPAKQLRRHDEGDQGASDERGQVRTETV